VTSDVFTLTAEFTGDRCWHVCRGTTASHTTGPAWPSTAAQLSAFADALCAEHGGWAVRSVVFVGPPCATGAMNVATYPRQVWVLSPGRALVSSLEDGPQSAVVADLATQSASVHIGDAERALAGAEPERVADVMRALDITRLLLRGVPDTADAAQRYRERCPDTCEVIECGPEAVRTGAERFAAGLMKGEGVWFAARDTTVMRGRREISYSIHHTRYGAFDTRDVTLAEVADGAPLIMVIDRNVDAVHGTAIRAYSRKHLNVKASVTVDASEQAKGVEQVEQICRAAADAALPRHGLIVAVGGGVTLDIAGLAASMFRRGVSYIRVPTTLVGLVDVAVGIKQGVNAFGRKNILGSFFPPMASVNDYSLLRTSSRRSISCGLAEILKIALVRDEKLLAALEDHGRELLSSRCQTPTVVASPVLRRAETLMMEELAPNLFETDLARLVDFGHTFSPLIETASDYGIAHGEAVALDILMSTGIAVARGLCASDLPKRLTTLFPALNLPMWHERLPDVDDLLRALDGVVAHRGGNLNLVVPTRAGAATFVQHVTTPELAAALDWMQSNATASQPDLDRNERTTLASAGL
jgi:3-dehydroquinate synthase